VTCERQRPTDLVCNPPAPRARDFEVGNFHWSDRLCFFVVRAGTEAGVMPGWQGDFIDGDKVIPDTHFEISDVSTATARGCIAHRDRPPSHTVRLTEKKR
jgi:hypothetical protein